MGQTFQKSISRPWLDFFYLFFFFKSKFRMSTIIGFFQNFEKIVVRGSNFFLKILLFFRFFFEKSKKVKAIPQWPKTFSLQILQSDFHNNPFKGLQKKFCGGGSRNNFLRTPRVKLGKLGHEVRTYYIVKKKSYRRDSCNGSNERSFYAD